MIFPYRQHGAPDESGDANHPKLVARVGLRVVGGHLWSVGPDPVVVKRWGDAGR